MEQRQEKYTLVIKGIYKNVFLVLTFLIFCVG